MKQGILILFLSVAGLFSQAQNVVYDENAEVRVSENFNAIQVSGTVSLYLSQGTTQGVAVSAGDAKYNSKIRTETKNGVLHISVEGGMWNGFNWTNKKLKAYITFTDLKRLEVSGASYVTTTGLIKTEELKLDVTGASELKCMVNVTKLKVDISGASVAKLSGIAKESIIDASGASKLNGYDLNVDNLNVSTSGASNVRVTVGKEINGNASGGSTIYYKGPGVANNINQTGGASIKSKSGSED